MQSFLIFVPDNLNGLNTNNENQSHKGYKDRHSEQRNNAHHGEKTIEGQDVAKDKGIPFPVINEGVQYHLIKNEAKNVVEEQEEKRRENAKVKSGKTKNPRKTPILHAKGL